MFGPANHLGLVSSPIPTNTNLTQQNQLYISKTKDTTKQNKHKRLNQGFVTQYDFWPRNDRGLVIT